MKTNLPCLKSKSPAEFFAENKNIAGFDNPGKSLYTTVRELVENALDSCEGIGEPPNVAINISEVSSSQLNDLRGVANTQRIDEDLYRDSKSTSKGNAGEIDEQGQSNMETAATAKPAPKHVVAAAKGTAAYYRVSVEDNGSGMPHREVPDMLGRALSGTKYGVRQTRGKFGLGAKMALIWSKMTTGMPFQIVTAQVGQKFRSEYTLDMDIHKNEPHVHAVAKVDDEDPWHGTRLGLIIQGAWASHRAFILRYLRQIAVITPYAQISFEFSSLDGRNDVSMMFKRRTTIMPDPPRQVQHHPSSVDLELVKRLLKDTRCKNLKQFLKKEFSNISGDYSGRLIQELQTKLSADSSPQSLSAADATKLHNLLRSAKFPNPDGVHLSSAGEYNLRLGVIKELHPDLIATHQGEVGVFEGHAFIIEAAISLGGNMRPGINVHRFANRIPLLFEGGSDVVTRTATKRISWSNYRINHSSDKIGVFVSIVSTKIPFKGAGKEYIGDDIEEMVLAVKHSMQQCCLQLKAKLVKRQAAQQQRERKQILAKHIPNAAQAFMDVLNGMRDTQAGPKRKRILDGQDLVSQVDTGTLSQAVIAHKLADHVESVDADMMMEYHMQRGLREKGDRKSVV